MTNILTPGYVRWDGTNYVTDPFSPDDLVGPPGPVGPFGGTGPQGPIGPTGPTGAGGFGSTPFSSTLYVDGNFATTTSSDVVSIDFWSSNVSYLSGLSSITEPKLYIGKYATISGAADPNNNGTFLIVSYNSGLGIYNPLGSGPDANNGSITGTITIDTSDVPEGIAASISSFDSIDIATITGLTDMDSSFIGKRIIISLANSSGNSGGFVIVSVNSATSVNIYNPNAVAPDINNGFIKWTLRDGSLQKPFRTIQSAIDSVINSTNNLVPNAYYSIRLLLTPGYYLDDVQISTPTDNNHNFNIVIASIIPDPSGYSNFYNSDGIVNIGIGGYAGGIFYINTDVGSLTLQDVFMRSPITSDSSSIVLRLIRTNAITYSSNIVASSISSDASSSINLLTSTPVFAEDLHNSNAYSGASGIVSYNPFNSNYIFSGAYILSVYITVTTGSTTGTLDLTAEWIDFSGAKSQQMITSFDVTSGGPRYAYANLAIVPNSNVVTYSISTTGVTGSLNYIVDFAMHFFQF